MMYVLAGLVIASLPAVGIAGLIWICDRLSKEIKW